MKDHELDRILSGEDEIVPSSGFVRNVMEGVRMEASGPPPIPFPWARALPGLLVSILSLAAMCVMAFSRAGTQPVREVAGPSILEGLMTNIGRLLSAANVGGLYWIILALLLTLASVKLSLRLVRSH